MESRSFLEQASGELLTKIREINDENVDRTSQDLTDIKEWLRKQPHLPDEWEDRCLISFLRGCKFSVEKCKRKLEMYFTMRTICPEFFSNRNIKRPELIYVISKGQGVILPKLTPQGGRVTIFRTLDKSFDIDYFSDALKLSLMLGDIRIKEEIVGISGDIFVVDASILKLHYIAKVPLTLIKKFVVCALQAYPVKLREFHVINPTPLLDLVFNMVKPFVKAKILDRVIIHSDISSLYDYIPKNILPVEFGGDFESMETLQKLWLQKLDDYTPWFEAQEQIKADESLRPGKPMDYDELFGIEGSFRQISID